MFLPLRKNKNIVVLVLLIVFQLVLISFQVPLGNEPSLFEKSIFTIFSPIKHSVQFLVGSISYPITRKLVEEINKVYHQTDIISYLDVETGGIFLYLSYGIGVLCLIIGTIMCFDRLENKYKE